MENFKIRLMVINRRIKSQNITSIESNLFQKLLERKEVEGLNISLHFLGKNSAEFISTNEKTIKQNIRDYYNEEVDTKHYFNFMNLLNSELTKALNF